MFSEQNLLILKENDFDGWKEGVCVDVVSRRSHQAEPHTHQYFELVLILSGRIEHYVNGMKEVLEAGDCELIRKDDVHYYLSHKDFDFEFLNICFTQNHAQRIIDLLNIESSDFITSSLPLRVNLSLDRFISIRKRVESSLIDPFGMMIIKTIILELLVAMIRRSVTPKSSSSWFDVIYEEINKPENFTKGIERLYELSYYTHEHIYWVFKKNLGVSPTKYINNLKIAYARQLLVYTDLTVTEIAEKCGFENLSHFYHLFKKQYIASPGTFRKRQL